MATYVMTGGSSGFGAHTAAQLAGAADARVIVGARRPAQPADVLDLTSLDSVRSFASSVRRRLDDEPLDGLVLNAGGIRPDAEGRTADGLETTFVLNHLAHHLLARLLLPVLADGARVVVTTSGTHDPATGAGLEVPRHADADLLAHPEQDPALDRRPAKAGQHAYTAAKLCVVLNARRLRAEPVVVDRGVDVVAFDPGQVFGTGLARDLSVPLRVAWSVLGTRAGAPLRRLRPTMNTVAAASQALADLARGVVRPPDDTGYAALRGGRLDWTDPSELARRDDVADALWEASGRLAGQPPDRHSSTES